MSDKQRYIIMPPQLGDGVISTIEPIDSALIAESLETWLSEAEPGDEIVLKICSMTEEEFLALPEGG